MVYLWSIYSKVVELKLVEIVQNKYKNWWANPIDICINSVELYFSLDETDKP